VYLHACILCTRLCIASLYAVYILCDTAEAYPEDSEAPGKSVARRCSPGTPNNAITDSGKAAVLSGSIFEASSEAQSCLGIQETRSMLDFIDLVGINGNANIKKTRWDIIDYELLSKSTQHAAHNLLSVNDSCRYLLVIAVALANSRFYGRVRCKSRSLLRSATPRSSRIEVPGALCPGSTCLSCILISTNDTTQVCKCARLVDTSRRAQTQTRYERYTRNIAHPAMVLVCSKVAQSIYRSLDIRSLSRSVEDRCRIAMKNSDPMKRLCSRKSR